MLKHGGDLNLAVAQYKIPLEDWLDLSTGINPHGYPIPSIPPNAWQRLPMNNDGLIETACAYYGCASALPTAGSQAALQALPRLRESCQVAMLDPMYQEHHQAWQQCGHQISTFTHLGDQVLNSADVVLLCNPNNPTTTLFSPADLLALQKKLQVRGAWLIVDEAFMDTTPEYSIAKHAHLSGLFVLRSLGKFFGLAGIRVGFLLAKQTQLNKIQEMLGPWTVTGPSRLIAKQALQDKTWQQKIRLQLIENSQRLAALLSNHGLAPQASTSLFQYVLSDKAEAIQQALAKQGIWVRVFANPSALRFGLPSAANWHKLERALNNI